MRVRSQLLVLALAGFAFGCTGLPTGGTNGPDVERPKTLLTWTIGKEPDDKKVGGDKNGANGNGRDNGDGKDEKVGGDS